MLKHVKEETKRLQQLSSKKSLLTASEDGSDSEDPLEDTQSMWLNLTTKQHIVDKNRLRPSRIKVPNSLNKSSSLSICIISADPQRALKDIVADPTFPTSSSSRIGRVIGYSKLKAKYHSFESRRQLLSEYDVFLADDRIVTKLPDTLGKAFFKGTAKRPIPIRIALEHRLDGKRIKAEKKKSPKNQRVAEFASAAIVAKEIEAALNSVPISLKPGTSVAVRVGISSFTAQELADNVSVVAQKVIEKHVVKGWRNVKAIHVKSPNSAAIPIWLADDMWVNNDQVADDIELTVDGQKVIEDKKTPGKKRKARSEGDRKGHAQKKTKAFSAEEDDRALAAARKAKLAQMKSKAISQASTLVA